MSKKSGFTRSGRRRTMEKLYKVQMNSKGMPNFSTAVEVADRPQGEWIPCSERLPEAGVSVIVTSKGGYVYTSNIAHGEWEYGGDVVAWMPLPKPYGEREGE